MKKIFATLCMALCAAAMMGQQPVITFETTEHDFGKINEADGRVSFIFSFKNEGMTPLVLSNVRASCGCTTPTWTKEPVEPGQTGSITVTYNPNGRPGRFQKTITITSNATEPSKKIYIKGEVIPKPAKPVNQYAVKMGALSLKSKSVDLGVIKKGEFKQAEIEYANLTQEEHRIELATNSADAYITNQVTLSPAQPNAEGKFIFVLDSKSAKIYGPVEVYAYVVVDGKKSITEEYKLTIKANIVEDFSQLTLEQKQQAPICELANEQNAGKIAPGQTWKFVFPIKNVGVNPLEIRRIYSDEKRLTIKYPKSIKSSKKSVVTIDINTTGLEAGAYTREVVIITNDYQNPIKRIKLNFVVE